MDAAVDLGVPTVVFDMGGAFARSLPNGMSGIIGNAWGLSAMPSEGEIGALMQAFSLRRQGLLARDTCAPMLVINGEHDQYIPQQDSTLFARYPNNRVWLMRNMTHCAAEGVPRIVPAMTAWLCLHLYGETVTSRLALRLAKCLLPVRVQATLPSKGAVHN